MVAGAELSFDLLAPAVVNGIALGGLYGLLAVTIVVLFRTTGIGNFAAGNISMFLSFIMFIVLRDHGLGPWAAFAVGACIAVLFGTGIYGVVMLPRSDLGSMNLTFRTLGLFLLLFAVATRWWGDNQPYTVSGLFPRKTMKVLGFHVSYDQLGAMGATVLIALALFVFFNRSTIGLTMRAVASDRATAQLIGIRVVLVEACAWALVGLLGFVVGVLFAPVTLLSSEMMGPFLVQAFTAAILGGIYSVPGALIGGLILGVVAGITGVYADVELRYLISLVVMVGILLVRPAGLFGTERVERL